MELATEPDVYSPSINQEGVYIDKVMPCMFANKRGLRCMCGSRKDKIYPSISSFHAHMTTKIHKQWIDGINTNRFHYYVKSHDLEDTVKQQRLIIATMEKEIMHLKQEIQERDRTIDAWSKRIDAINRNFDDIDDTIDWTT